MEEGFLLSLQLFLLSFQLYLWVQYQFQSLCQLESYLKNNFWWSHIMKCRVARRLHAQKQNRLTVFGFQLCLHTLRINALSKEWIYFFSLILVNKRTELAFYVFFCNQLRTPPKKKKKKQQRWFQIRSVVSSTSFLASSVANNGRQLGRLIATLEKWLWK